MALTPCLGDKNVFLPPGTGWAPFIWGFLSPTFRKKKEGQGALHASAVFQELLIQNNQYARMAYFGVAGSEPLQSLPTSSHKRQFYYKTALK